jgi:hypothetical protein
MPYQDTLLLLEHTGATYSIDTVVNRFGERKAEF